MAVAGRSDAVNPDATIPHDAQLLGGAVPRAFFRRPAPEVARDLIGALLLVGGVGGTVVETEAYARDDPASHSYRGRTRRNASMFGPAGHAYVYRSYGLHWCLNAVCGPGMGVGADVEDGHGSAVLIRAVEPLLGLDTMRARRGAAAFETKRLCAGPGRLCRALGVTDALDGQRLDQPPFRIEERRGPMPVAVGRRVGITHGVETPWRFGLAGSRFLSRPIRG